LNVNDGELESEPDVVVVTVTSSDNKPIANAGENIIAQVGDLIRFDGSKSEDVNGNTLTFKWRIPGSEFDIIYDGVSPTHTFNKPGIYTVTLSVNDGELESEPDEVIVTVTEITDETGVPAEDVPAEDVPAEDVPAEDVPAEDVLAEDVLAEVEQPDTGDARVIGEVESNTGDARIEGEVEDDTGSVRVEGEVEDDTGSVRVTGQIEGN